MNVQSTGSPVRWMLVAVAAVVALESAALAAPSPASSSASQSSSQRQDAVIRRAFQDYLKREPTGTEMKRYRSLMRDAYWTEADVREDVRAIRDREDGWDRRPSDPDRVIRRAYLDILKREPDPEGLRHYRIEMIDNGWTEQDVRKALRTSAERERVKADDADRIIRRAYQDLLEREPDPQGLARYRTEMLKNGWTERDVREAIRKSPEYRDKNTMSREKAEQIVNRAYRNVLGRDADAAGMEGYILRVLRDKWTQADVERELRKSEEYRKKK